MYCSSAVYSMHILTALLLPTMSTSETERVVLSTRSVMTSSPEGNSSPSTLVKEPSPEGTHIRVMTPSPVDNSSPSTLVNEPSTVGTHNRVMYGDKASISRFPFIVSIQKPYGHHNCGGTLVRPDWVLTATHCLVYNLMYMHNPRIIFVIAGNTNVLRLYNDHPDSRRVTATFIHDQPVITRTRRHDIGLVRLSSAFVLRPTIQLVPLPPLQPPREQYDDDDAASKKCLLAGWGHHVTEPDSMKSKPAKNRDFGWLGEQLHYTELERINTSTCQDLWMIAANVTSVTHVKHVCTSGAGGRDSCKGDSGGPLMCGGVQMGVVSYVYTCGRNVTPPHPVVYVRVAHYVRWIDDVLRANGVPEMTQDDLEREALQKLKSVEAGKKIQTTSGVGKAEASVVFIAIGMHVILKQQS